jgi:hypothetical protein
MDYRLQHSSDRIQCRCSFVVGIRPVEFTPPFISEITSNEVVQSEMPARCNPSEPLFGVQICQDRCLAGLVYDIPSYGCSESGESGYPDHGHEGRHGKQAYAMTPTAQEGITIVNIVY